MLITLASIAVFMRDYLFDIVTAAGPAQIPGWLQDLSGSDLASIDTGTGRADGGQLPFERDGIILGLPLAGGMPAVMLDVVLAGLVAAGVAGAGLRPWRSATCWPKTSSMACRRTRRPITIRLTTAA